MSERTVSESTASERRSQSGPPGNHAVIDLLADLVRINSVNPNYEGGVPEAELADFVQQYFTALGVETWRQQVYPERPNVIARIRGRTPQRRIVL
ncbi:MAG: hypothetical protein ACF788_04330, partial [Novipirellula sp. JB048]